MAILIYILMGVAAVIDLVTRVIDVSRIDIHRGRFHIHRGMVWVIHVADTPRQRSQQHRAAKESDGFTAHRKLRAGWLIYELCLHNDSFYLDGDSRAVAFIGSCENFQGGIV